MARILIIDDERSYCESLKFFLSRRGHDVCTATAGDAGITLGIGFQPHLLIVDWMLKNSYSGAEVAIALRALNKDLRTIVITGYVDLSRRSQSIEVFDRVLQKPFRSEALVQAVDELLGDMSEPSDLQCKFCSHHTA